MEPNPDNIIWTGGHYGLEIGTYLPVTKSPMNGHSLLCCKLRYLKVYEDKDGYYRFSNRINKKHHIVALHRFVFETIYKVKLTPSISVHHKDGNVKNNNPSNLEMIPHGVHVSNHRDQERIAKGRLKMNRKEYHKWYEKNMRRRPGKQAA